MSAYDGGLFTTDKVVAPAGAALTGIALPDAVFEPVLEHLLLVHAPEGPLGPVDFRALGVREFGTIYEGLLESELSVADIDLAVDAKGSYVPHRGRQTVEVPKGTIYIHDRSGSRKSSGSYFTKSFAVEHLLDRALEPELDDHLQRLDTLDEASATEMLFDFRVADIAMGSGHFLVAAIDRIEDRITRYLSRRPLPGVQRELANLREAAERQLGPEASHVPIEDAQLLRRLIARRCIYGVDLNTLALELARLSIWIHTFVPGLPLTVLDHNLVQGNALVGIGTIEEIRNWFERHSTMLFPVDADNLLGQAKQPLTKLAKLADASLKDVDAARGAMEEARLAMGPTRALCDIIIAEPLNAKVRYQPDNWDREKHEIHKSPAARHAASSLAGLHPLHFPVAFPEVFLRRTQGFDMIVGNPPWEKARVEEHESWARHFPGLRSLSAAEKEQRVAQLRKQRSDLLSKWECERDASQTIRDAVRHIPDMSTGHPDFFRAFLWRFTQLVANPGGRVAVVLPGDAFKIKGGAQLRRDIVRRFSTVEINPLTNKAEWVFDNVDPRQFIALFTGVANDIADIRFQLTAECHCFEDWEKIRHGRISFDVRWLEQFSSSLVIPTLAGASDVDVIDAMMRSPRIADHPEFRVRRVYADFETTRDRTHYHPNHRAGDWPVYKGESFDIWDPDRGEEHYFMWTTASILDRAQERRQRSPRTSPYGACPTSWINNKRTHAIQFPRIAFRDVSNRTNQRTLIVTLIPPKVVTTQTAPWVLWLEPNHDPHLEALLVGILSSRICDWWMRRFAEGHVDEEAFNCIRAPIISSSAPRLTKRGTMIAGRLAAPDKRFASWAEAVGVEWGPLQDGEKQDMIAELDAVVAHLYRLAEKQLVHVFETFHEGWDYEPRLNAVLRHFRAHDRASARRV